MKRVCVLGSSGAGKTTLAAAIAARTGLPHLSLDAFFWQPGWAESDAEIWEQTHRDLISRDAWVIDGNYFSTLESRLAAADTAVFFDLPRWRCLARILTRTLRWYGRTRPDMGPGCPERFDLEFVRYVWNFPRDHRPSIEVALDNAPLLTVIRIRNDRDRAVFLASL